MAVQFRTSNDPIIITDPAVLMFLSHRVKEEEEFGTPRIRKNFETCMQYGKSRGIGFPAGVIYASYVRWLRYNTEATLAAFLTLNDVHSVFARYMESRYRNEKVVYPSSFQTAPF